MINEAIRVAVIIPVYKVERYLERCIKSVCAQDYKNIEIVLVDDGSPDKCPALCDQLACTDARIRVFHKSNGGLSDARNYGVNHCESEYVVFVDSDDYVDVNYVSSLVNLYREYDADVACTPLLFEYVNGKQKRIKKYDRKRLDSLDAVKMVMRVQYGIGVTACSKLFHKDLLLRHPFPVGRLHEDIAVAFDLYNEAGTVAISSEQTYHYMQHEESITHKAIDFENLYWIISCLEKLIEENDDHGIKCSCAYRIYELVNEICRVVDVNSQKDEIKRTQDMVRPYLSYCLNDPLNDWQRKAKCILMAKNYASFKLYLFLKNTLK